MASVILEIWKFSAPVPVGVSVGVGPNSEEKKLSAAVEPSIERRFVVDASTMAVAANVDDEMFSHLRSKGKRVFKLDATSASSNDF